MATRVAEQRGVGAGLAAALGRLLWPPREVKRVEEERKPVAEKPEQAQQAAAPTAVERWDIVSQQLYAEGAAMYRAGWSTDRCWHPAQLAGWVAALRRGDERFIPAR